MNNAEFIFELVRAGYTKDQCLKIATYLQDSGDRLPYCMDDLRQVAYDYLICCTDLEKLKGYLVLSDQMARRYNVSFNEASGFVLNVLIGWCP